MCSVLDSIQLLSLFRETSHVKKQNKKKSGNMET